MVTRVSFEQFKSFIDWQLQPRGPSSKLSPRPFVTIARQAGAGAVVVAEKLARLLEETQGGEGPWSVFDKRLVEKVLADHHLPTRIAAFMPEDRTRYIQDTLEELLGLHPSVSTLVERTASTILHLAMLGNVILVGRGSHIITSQMPLGLHVRLVGSVEQRATRIAAANELTREEALRTVKALDRGRRAYVKEHYHQDVEDPSRYHLTINTDWISTDETATIIKDTLLLRAAVKAV